MGLASDLSRSDVENLLAGFLTGARSVQLGKRLTELDDLPAAYRTHVQLAEASGVVWAAWSTQCGPVVAWAKVDAQGSGRSSAYLLQFEWYETLSGHHALWCHCDPKRPTEWTIGRGGTGHDVPR
jgi:hypothetical protein